MNSKPEFYIDSDTEEYIYIIDDSDNSYYGAMTITNGVEYVVQYLHQKYDLGKRRLFYKDTEGRIDEIVHNGKGDFIDFSAGHWPYEL
jgi:hypothetical protein